MNTEIFKDPEIFSRLSSAGFPLYTIQEAPALSKSHIDIMKRVLPKIVPSTLILVIGSDDIYKDVFMILLGYHLTKKFKGRVLKYIDSFPGEYTGISVMPSVDQLGISKSQYFREYVRASLNNQGIILVGSYEVNSFLAFIGEPFIEKYSRLMKVLELPKIPCPISLESL